ncbi:hypothetical protein [Promineifilum sp.]|uniref:hypothetical protein n=1 Tax=Promineifilum sp. TaxID=2664178 RepID=UPI0035AE1F8F
MNAQLTRSRKVTITLPDELVVYADRRASSTGTSRSQVISQALASLMSDEERELAAEGYRFYAAEAEEFAAASGPSTAEAAAIAAPWDDAA